MCIRDRLDRDAGRVEAKLFGAISGSISPRPSLKGDYKSCESLLLKGFNVATLSGFDDFSKLEISALGVIYDYVQNTQAVSYTHLDVYKRQALTIPVVVS